MQKIWGKLLELKRQKFANPVKSVDYSQPRSLMSSQTQTFTLRNFVEKTK